jgi:hypothetical protein
MSMRWLPALVILAACAPPPAREAKPAATETASAPAPEPPAPRPAPVLGPTEVVRPGWRRIAFDLPMFQGDGRRLQGTIDAPASWGIEVDEDGFDFRACHGIRELPPLVSLLARATSGLDEKATAVRTVEGDFERVVVDETDGDRREIWVVVGNEAGFAQCLTVILSSQDELFGGMDERAPEMAAVCGSVRVGTPPPDAEPLAARPPEPDEISETDTSGAPPAVHEAARRYFAAAAARDRKAVTEMVLTVPACRRAGGSRGECTGMQASMKKELPKMIDMVPEGFDVGDIQLRRVGKLPVFTARAFPKAAPCIASLEESPITFITLVDGKAYVGVLEPKKAR